MLKVRIIPTLLWKNVGLVKGIAFDSWRRVGTVMPSIKVYNTRDVDEIILLDISATQENRVPDYEELKLLAGECFVPLTVGGGISNIETIKNLLRAGADKVAINTAAYENPLIISKAANYFGSQCIIASVDAKLRANGQYECFSCCGTKPTGKTPVQWAQELQRLGAGEILITSISHDGTMQGYDLELIHSVSQVVDIPVIASGGAGDYQHMYDALSTANATAVAAASIFHFTEKTPAEAKKYLASKGIPVRNTQQVV